MTTLRFTGRDIALVALVGAIGQEEVWAPVRSIGAGEFGHGGPNAALSAAYLVAAGALLWRRRFPLAVVAVVAGVLSLEFIVFGSADGLGSILPALCAVYAVGRYGSRKAFWAGLALTAAHVAVHEWRDPHFSLASPSPAFWVVFVAAGVVGRLLAVRAAEVRAATDRADVLAAAGEEQYRQAAADERARIARELHDLVGHGLSLLVLQLVAAQSELEKGEAGKTLARLARLEVTARDTLAETRRLVSMSGDGEAALAPQPGVPDIAALIDQVRLTGLAVHADVDPAAEDIAEGVGLAVYRLVQEALTNVVKHAGPLNAARAFVAVRRGPGAVDVEVVDRSGNEVSPAPVGPGRGLVGMRERVELYGGTLTAGPEAGGFAVRATIPLEANPLPTGIVR